MMAAAAPVFAAGPVDFGMAEVQRAVAARGLPAGSVRFKTEISVDAPETYRILPGVIAGGDLRGLMYGLLDAAEQIRETGRLTSAKGAPAAAIRGVRRALSTNELQQEWSASREYWRNYLSMLARNRFNRLTLEFPRGGDRWKDVLRIASEAAPDYGIDLALGVGPQGPPIEEVRQALLAHASVRTLAAAAEAPAEWYGDLAAAVARAGRRIAIDLPSPSAAALGASAKAHAAVRISTPYWPGGLGRPYQPAETLPGLGYLNLLERTRSYDLYWDLGAPGVRRWLLWGDAEFVRRAAGTLGLGGAAGFEIDAPGWMDFDRHWLFYLLWGRLTYDPKTPEKVWMAEMKRRYSSGAPEVWAAYQAASGALDEIAAANLGWPLDFWEEARPGDWRTMASVAEAVKNRLRGAASAKQTPLETAELLLERAGKIEAALEAARGKIPESHREWGSAASDFAMVAQLARYHAHRHLAATHTAWFDETGDADALAAARREMAGALAAAEKLAATGAGASLAQKLPEPGRDVQSITGRERILEQLGPFEFGFDFGPADRARVAPRFQAVDPATEFTVARGYGWAAEGDREAGAEPGGAPLYGDWIRGRGSQRFRVRAEDGAYQALLVGPKGPAEPKSLRARNGVLEIVFPAGEWTVSGLVAKREGSETAAARPWPKRAPRPSVLHTPVKTAPPGQPLALLVRILPAAGVKAVRLHYRPVNQLAKFKTIENAGAKGAFTIPAEDLSKRWDLLYYFEILSQDSGWFEPDPRAATPYYVVRVEEPAAAAQ